MSSTDTQTHRFVICLHQSCLLRCRGNSWYSAILIIFMAKYQALIDD